jgi:hypothetical protein
MSDTDTPTLYVSVDSGNSWRNIMAGTNLPSRVITDIAFDPWIPTTIYVALPAFG